MAIKRLLSVFALTAMVGWISPAPWLGYSPAEAAVAFRAASSGVAGAGSVTFRSAAQAGAGSGVLTLTISKPAGTTQNDVMIATIGVRPYTATITPPSGWTLVRRVDGVTSTPSSLAVYRKVAGASEPANYSWTFNNSSGSAGGILSFSGVDTTTPIDVENGQSTPAGLTHSTPSITTTVANAMLVASYTFASSATWTSGSGMTEAVDVMSGPQGCCGQSLAAYYVVQGSAGATGAKSATASNDGTDDGSTHLLALRPAGGVLTISKPAGTAQNDVMIASIGVRPNTVTITAPSGWTLVRRIDSATGTSNSLAVYRKVAGASEPASYTWTLSSNTGAAGGIQTFAGVDTTTPIDVENGWATAAAATHSTPSVTTTVANTMLVTSFGVANANTWSPPAGMTEAFDVKGGLEAVSGDYAVQAAAGSTGSKTATDQGPDAVDGGAAHILALRPALACGAVSDAGYVAATAQSGQVTLYWSSADPVLILRKTAAFAGETPTDGVSYTVGGSIGAATVVDNDSAVKTSFSQSALTNGTTYYYKVFARAAGPCYSPGTGTEIGATPQAGPSPAWSYTLAGGSMLRPGIAGKGTIHTSSNASRLISLETSGGTQSWQPVATSAAVQGWLTWLPVGGDVSSGLVGHWKLDDGSGPTAADSSGGGNTGTLQNGPAWTTGKIGGGLSFDGVDDHVAVSGLLGGPASITLAAWVNLNAPDTNGAEVISLGDAVALRVDEPGARGTRGFYFDGATWHGTDSGRFYAGTGWHHVAYVIDGTTSSQRVYVDGLEVASSAHTQAISYAGVGANTFIGRHGNGAGAYDVNGLIDDVRVYNRALSAAEVSKLHLRGGGWQYRKKLSIDKSKVAGALTDFPVLVSLTDAELGASAQPSGADILFTAGDGTTKLSHEIETYDSATGTLLAWVKVPSLSATADTDLYMYYGDAGASDQQHAAGVWSNGYVGVWHLKETTGGAGAIKDSTSNANHGTDTNGPTLGAAGQVDGSVNFDGLDDHVSMGDPASLNIAGAITLEAWINLNVAQGSMDAYAKVVNKWWGSSGGYAFMFNSTGTTIQMATADGATQDGLGFTFSFTPGTWYHVVGTWSPNPGMKAIYIDGTQRASTTSSNATIAAVPQNVELGGTAPDANSFNGKIDEVRISNVARSAAWIATEHTNQSDPATFLTVGGEEPAATVREAVIGGDQSGRVYSVDTVLGTKNWEVALTSADAVQASLAAQVRAWSNATFQAAHADDLVFAATRNASSTNNKVFALRASDGSVAWTFNDTGAYAVDYVVGMPWVDYSRNRLYVASRAGSAGSQQSLWVLSTIDGSLVTSFALGHLEASPLQSYDLNTLWVGNTAGDLHAVDAITLAPKWTEPLGTAVKGTIWEDWFTSGLLYFSTADGNVRAVQDTGAAASPLWTTPVAGPSSPLVMDKVYVGSSDGKVHQLDLVTGVDEKQFPAASTLDGSTAGDVSTETGNEIFVGTAAGRLYKIPLPLP